ncbi:MAG: succinate dehydrogenase [Parachlamydiaceae bacterium]
MTGSKTIPKAFIWRRLHSLTGFFLALYLFEHLLVNSQAALYFGDDGSGFVEAVDAIHRLPYLVFLEMGLLGIPILLHAGFGIQYLLTAQSNSRISDGSKPSLPEYSRNRAYTWQRITSWILLFALAFHIIQMRFVAYPSTIKENGQHLYMVRMQEDSGLESLSKRLKFSIYTQNQADQLKPWNDVLEKKRLQPGEVVGVTPSFGMAELLIVRETFKMPLMLVFYTLFVLAACFHAYNGLWTFMISWGINLSQRSQTWMLRFCILLMILVAFFGLSAIWATYWINLKQ